MRRIRGSARRVATLLDIAGLGVLVLLVPLGCATQRGVDQSADADDGESGPVSRFVGAPEEEDVRLDAADVQSVRVSYKRGAANYVIAGEATETGPRPDYTAKVPGPKGPPKPGGRGVGFPVQAPSPPSPIGPPTQGTEFTPPSPGPQGAAPLTSSFETIDTDTNVTNTSGFLFIPPDSHAAVGPDHVVVVTNVTIRFHEKDGTLVHDESLADFFSGESPSTFTFDPKVVFDEDAQRFVVVTLEMDTGPNKSMAYLAVSDDADPTGTWHSISINTLLTISSCARWFDFPGFAVDEEAVYLNGNMFAFSFCPAGPFGGVRLWTIEKGDGAGGWFDGGTAVVNGPFDPYGGGGVSTTTQPAMIRSDPGATYGAPGNDVGTFLVSYSGLTLDNTMGCDATCAEAVQIVRIDDPLGTPTFIQEFLDIGNIEDNVLFPPLPDAPQSGSATDIETNDQRALDAVWRDGDLFMVATVNPFSGGDSGEATAHWWELDTSTLSSGGSAETTLTDQDNIGGEDVASNAHTFFPAIDINAAGDLAVGYSASAGSIFAGSFYSIRESGNASFGAADTLRDGTDWYVRTFGGPENRWGDYSGMVVEESTGCFWVYNQHAMTRGTPTTMPNEDGRWRTTVGEICLDGGGCLPSTTVSGTITGVEIHKATDITVTADVTGTGNLTLEGETIGFENGASVAVGGELHVVHGCPGP